MIDMVLDMLLHRTPPSSISPTILTVLEICVPCWKIVKELPSNNWIRQCRTLLVFITKTLAAIELGLATSISNYSWTKQIVGRHPYKMQLYNIWEKVDTKLSHSTQQ